MLRLNSFLIFIFVFINVSKAQYSQLTYIENLIPTLKYDLHGLVNIDGTDYLIETNDESIRVSRMDDAPEVLYEEEYPSYYQVHQKNGMLNTRSGYAVYDIYLFELFKKRIQKRNLLTGEVEETFNLTAGQMVYLESIEFTETMFHFELSRNFDFASYNITTEKFEFLDFKKNSTYRAQNTYYTQSEDGSIEIYNAEDKTSTFQYENEDILNVGSDNLINGQKGLVFSTSNYSRFINEDTTFLLDCLMYEPSSTSTIIREREGHLMAFYEFDNKSMFQIMNKSFCFDSLTVINPKDDEDKYYKVFDSPTFDQGYILFAQEYGSINPVELLLIDKEDLTIHTLDNENINFIDENSFYRIGDILYFIGHDGSSPFPNRSLFSVNLLTKEFKTKQTEFTFDIPISFGTSENNRTLLLTKSFENKIEIYDFEDGENNDLFYTSSDTKDGGLNEIRYLGADSYKIAFQFKNEVYFYDFFHDGDPIFEAEEITDLRFTNNTMEGLVNYDNSTYFLVYDQNYQTQTIDLLEEHVDVSNSITFSDYIFAQFSIIDKTYFEFETQSFLKIPIDGNIISMHRSKKHVLFLSNCDGQYCLTSFTNGEFSNYEYTFQNEPEVYPKGNGNFLVLEPKSDNVQSIYAISHDGIHIDKITVEGTNFTENQESIADLNLGAMIFYNEPNKELTVILQKDSKFQKFEIPYNNVNLLPVIWYKAGNSLVIKSEDYTDPGIYICTLGKETNKIELNDIGYPNYRLLMAIAKKDIVSIIVDSQLNDLQIAIYDTKAEKLNFVKNINTDDFEVLYDPSSIHTKIQTDDNEYFVTFKQQPDWGVYVNSEPYTYQTFLQLLDSSEDINWHADSSDPHNFLVTDDYFYFLAKSPFGNSYQLFSSIKHFTTPTKEIKIELKKVDVIPNPSSDFISVSSNAEFIKIYNSNGILLLEHNNYKANYRLSIGDLPQGLYTIELINKKIVSNGKFIKI